MRPPTNALLLLAAVLDAFAATVHLGCIWFGATWYRFFGAGEQMAQMVLSGSWYPTLVTSAIATVLFVWALFALSGAGVVRRLPLLRSGLCAISGVYLLRGVLPLLFVDSLPGRSAAFWWWSSAICLFIGLVHALGLWQVWNRLRPAQSPAPL